LFVERGESGAIDENAIIRTPRIGVGYAGEWASRPLRFVIDPGHVKLGKVAADSVGKVARTREMGA
jgi:3-methyladenine DNA glycosylase Mpg